MSTLRGASRARSKVLLEVWGKNRARSIRGVGLGSNEKVVLYFEGKLLLPGDCVSLGSPGAGEVDGYWDLPALHEVSDTAYPEVDCLPGF